MPPQNQIVVSGAREHNLKDVTSTLPRDALVVITGLSGSGKSSLAFDTIYAEGQRRYVESLSAYARQFLGQMDKPDVDSIEGLSPAISIDQKTTSRNPRSTVGTVTEIYDYLRLLWARIGQPHCHICGKPIAGPVGRADHRPGDGAAGGHALHGAGADRPRAQGRVRQGLRGAAGRGLRARRGRRRAADARGGDRARQEVQARHLGRRRPARDAGDVRKRLADSIETAVALADGMVEIETVPKEGEGDPAITALLREVRLPRPRARDPGARAADLLVQLAARRVRALHRPGLA